MPTRLLRESIVTSESVASMPPATQDRLPRYFLLADDFGCFLVQPAVIRGRVFPLRPDVTDTMVVDDLAACAAVGIVELYQGQDGKHYGWFPGWLRSQRAPRATTKRKCPAPPGSAGQCPAKPAEAGQIPPQSQSSFAVVLSQSQSSSQSQSQVNGHPTPEPDPSPPQAASPEEEPEVGKTTAVWNAYAAAYRTRYGASPIRNARINGQLAQLLRRIPQSTGPPIAVFYVQHNLTAYVKAAHPVGMLLNDCEKLHTEWVTGRQITATDARQRDRTQANVDGWGQLLKGDSDVARR